MRVNLGKWKVPLGAKKAADHFPNIDTLKKASLWTDPKFASLRAMLAKPPLQTGVEAIGTKVTQVRVSNTRTRLQCWNGQDGVPKECAKLPFRHAIIDLIGKNLKYVDDLTAVDGLSLMLPIPVILIGDYAVQVAYQTKLHDLWGAAREDSCRFIMIFTNENDPQYLARKCMCILLPKTLKFPKV